MDANTSREAGLAYRMPVWMKTAEAGPGRPERHRGARWTGAWGWFLAGLLAATGLNSASAQQPIPVVKWSLAAGGSQHDKTRGMAVDPEGNVLMTGEFTAQATFGEHVVQSVGSMDCFVAKVDPNGRVLWVWHGGGEQIDRGYAITTDRLGNCYVTGHYESTDARFGDVTLTNRGDYDLFVVKLDRNGKMLWIRDGGGAGYDYGHGLAVGSEGVVFVTGAIAGQAVFANQPLGEAAAGTASNAQLFCLSLTTDGQPRWQQTMQGSGSSSGQAIAVDRQGRAYVGGYAAGLCAWAGQTLRSEAGQDLIVLQLDTQGKLGWFHVGHGSAGAMIHDLTTDEQDHVWAVGMYRQDLQLADRQVVNAGQFDILLTRFDPDGKRLWTKTAGGVGIDYGLGVATDGQGRGLITGSFTGSVDFSGQLKQSQTAASDIFVAMYDAAGELGWFFQAGSERTDHAYPLVTDGRGHLYLSGACSGAARFGDQQLAHLGSNDLFLVQLLLP